MPNDFNFLAGGGEMGALMRAHDWSATPLGPPGSWSQSLRTAVRLLLTTQHPMFIWWGPELIQFYNDAYRQTMGPERHPGALGQRGRECWAEIWDIIGPQIEYVMAGKGATWHEDHLVPVTRYGHREDVWWTYGYSPIDIEGGGVGGVLVVCRDVTDEHRATEALKRANRRLAAEGDRLRQLFDQAPGFMCVLRGPDHVFELTNAAYLQLAGQRDLVGKPVREAFPEIEGQGFFELLDRVYATREPFVGRGVRIRVQTRPGGPAEERFIDFVYQPILEDPEGPVGGIFVEGSDVTERVVAEAERQALAAQLADERTRLQTLVEHLPVGVSFCDMTGASLLSNPAYRRFIGDASLPSRAVTAAEQWIGRDESGRLLAPDDYPGARALAGETVLGIEFRYRPAHGATETWTRVSGIPVRDGDGQLSGAVTVVVDIDAQKRAQEALLRLNETLERRVAGRTAELEAMSAELARLASVAENSPDFIGICDIGQQVLYVNPAGRRLIGIGGGGEMRRRRPQEYFVPEERARIEREVFPAVLERRHWIGELTFQHFRTGERIPVLYDVFRIDDPSTGKPSHFATVTRDLRERKQAEAALRQAQKMEAVGQLTGGVAHDFNNLLTAILGNLEILEMRLGSDERLYKLVQAAMRSAQRGAKLTGQLLAFSRRQHLATQAVDLNAAVTGMSEMLIRTLGGTVTVRTALAADLWPALVDATQIEVALLNLAINARDAMPLGGTLLISTRNVAAAEKDWPGELPPDGDYIAVSVTDTGTGMPSEVAARAFEPFFTTKEIGKGTGLGLSQVYGLARQSGGTARIRSTPGEGTTVEIYLPRAKTLGAEAGMAASLRTPDGDPAGSGAQDRHRGTVLVVDDQDEVREVAAAHLETLGYRVMQASSGRAVVELLKAGGAAAVDVLLVDYAMPDMSGTEVIRAARQARPDQPVVLMTGYADAHALGEPLPPAVVLLKKPFRMQELAAALEAAPRGTARRTESGNGAGNVIPLDLLRR